MRHLALACLLARIWLGLAFLVTGFLVGTCAKLALAQPIELTGTDTVRLWWEPATGPVVAYEAKLVYLDGTESTPQVVGPPPQQFTPRKGIAFRLTVRACRKVLPDLTVCDGEWSEPSGEVKLCPIAADVDCDRGVGVSDFTILVQDWGDTVDE